jgi:Flp pilus assembly CpaE family ATPase
LRRHLGKRVVACIPERPHEFRSAVDRGVSVREARPGSDVAVGIREVAAALGGRVPARGALARLAGRS